ncbi:sll0787 family AIR synthase-like protein [Zavarzinia aquatilis]|uniref:Sll0787 family AIR synthase-like protein n=1 Tax=Zavarzinia aquatilis TaxID=2211142 RepID=A0A317E3I2_9PROT|nr:sll0787 family AIR synthase-like protein [Zavarzinia aquatilis]PWR21152.1 sll0787 family AIR synthase-like protein [Zavarzinia aquatilis]
MSIADLALRLAGARGLGHKRDIAGVMTALGLGGQSAIAVGDDCAAIPDGDGYLLFAIEGFLADFVEAEPWFAGYCGVMVNVSDIAAMGGRPIAVVDALWSRDGARAAPILSGLAAGSAAYGVPIVGGHSNTRNPGGEQLSVAILGRARSLLTSFDAQGGDRLLMAIDLRGRYRDPHPYWDCSSTGLPPRLRAEIEILPALAEAGLVHAAKDISMAGAVGTALMLLECSGLGATIDVSRIPRPEGVALERWLISFPSFGYVLAVSPDHVDEVTARFAAAGIACADVGGCDAGGLVRLADGKDSAPLWNFARQPLIGCGPVTNGDREHA